MKEKIEKLAEIMGWNAGKGQYSSYWVINDLLI